MKKLIFILIIMIFSLGLSSAQAKEEEYLTWGELIEMLSETKTFQEKSASLLDWQAGFILGKIDTASTAPTIKKLFILPATVPSDGKTIFKIVAEITNPDGLNSIKIVKANLSPVGKLPNMKMQLKKKFEVEANHLAGYYGLENTVEPEINEGEKEIKVSAANNKGWLTFSKITLNVKN